MGREYQGAGGLRLHLDEPFSPQMAEQIRRGHLVPVADAEPEPEPADGAKAVPVEKPAANAKVDDWRAYAVHLGMDESEAAEATKKDLQEYVEVADGGSEG